MGGCEVIRPKVAVLSGFGINCETETITAFEMAGADGERTHVNRFVNGEIRLSEYDILAIPGGFSFGDHLGSGRLLGNRLRFSLREEVRAFVASRKPVIGICNGFQVLVKMGLLPGDEQISMVQTASLAANDCGRYEDRWVTVEFEDDSPCIWTRGLRRLRVPVRHGEGKFVTSDENLMDSWAQSGQLVARYVDPGTPYPSITDETLPYPISPNQSWRNVAGICDPTGLIFGLMPHPEAYHSTWLSPDWTRGKASDHGPSPTISIFRNAVEFSLQNQGLT